MTRPSIFAASLVALLGGATCANAQSAAGYTSTPGYYITGEGGASFLPDLSLKNTPLGNLHENFDTGYTFGGAFGYDMGNGTRVELDSLHQSSGLNSIDGLAAGGHLNSTSLMLNGQFDVMPNSAVTPYVGVGMGVQHVGANVQGLRDSAWTPAYQAEAGLRHDMTPNVSIFGEYRFSQAALTKLSDDGLYGHQHFADHALLAGVTYHLTP